MGDAAQAPIVTLEVIASLGSNFAIFQVLASGLDQVDLDASPAVLYEYDPPAGSADVPWISYLDAGGSQDSLTLGTSTLDVAAMTSIDVPFVNTEIMGCLHCPVKVKQRSGDDDFFAVAGELDVSQSFDPSSNPFRVELSNANGTIYSGMLLAGDLVRRGKKYDWRDRTAKTGPGLRDDLYKVQLKFMNYGVWKFKVMAFPDLSGATLPDMTIAITLDGNTYSYTGTFDAKKNGWQLRRFPTFGSAGWIFGPELPIAPLRLIRRLAAHDSTKSSQIRPPGVAAIRPPAGSAPRGRSQPTLGGLHRPKHGKAGRRGRW